MNYNTIISERQDRGEVITPITLVEEMLNKLPKEVFESKTTTFLDPCFGTGTFLKAIGLRLKAYGHSTENINSRLFGFEVDSRMFNETKRKFQGINIVKQDFLNTDVDMKFDVIVGNPPYNNKGKIKGSKQTSGNSLWIEFLGVIPNHLKTNGISLLIVPSAVANTNSKGWKKLKNNRVVEVITGIGHKFPGKIGAAISTIIFTNQPPSNIHIVDNIKVDRTKLPILPSNVNNISISIFNKLTSFSKPISFKRDYWTSFEENIQSFDISNIIGMSFLDRSKVYKLQSFEELNERNLKKVNICWTETEYPEQLIKFMASKLIQFYTISTMLSGNLSIGMVNAITYPDNWMDLQDDASIYSAYGLTQEEIDYIENAVK